MIYYNETHEASKTLPGGVVLTWRQLDKPGTSLTLRVPGMVERS